ncbi:hypothetical protein [Actinoplanes sp. URMC 104]|uniref:hypothetical protein n=1 Tax=Actinoplanes sp. URMC 104 TaxID=3423409 RepID=UPI003F1AD325
MAAVGEFPATAARTRRSAPASAGARRSYDDVVRLLDDGDVDGLVETLLHLDETKRRTLAARLRAAEPAGPRQEAALLVAGAGCLPAAEDVVAWLRSARLSEPMSEHTVAAIVRVLSAPGRPDPRRVAAGLAALPGAHASDRGEWALAAAALRATGQLPPATEAFVRGWIRDLSARVQQGPASAEGSVAGVRSTGLMAFVAGDPAGRLAARLGADPWLDTLVPHLFRLPKAAAALDTAWATALALLASTGRIDRDGLVGLVIERMRSGVATRPAVETYRRLDLSPDELLARRADLLELLGGPNGPVAEVAQRSLRLLDDSGRLDGDTVVEATRTVLRRTEKKLVRSQLSWVERAAVRHPRYARDLLAAAAVTAAPAATAVKPAVAAAPGAPAAKPAVTAAPAAPTAEPSVTAAPAATATATAAKPAVTAPSATPAVEPAVTAAPATPAAKPAGTAAPAAPDEPLATFDIPRAPLFPPRPIPYEAERMPPPLRTADELAAEAAALLDGPLRPVPLERVLAAAVLFPAAARPVLAALTDALTPAEGLQRMLLDRVREVAAGPAQPVLLATPATVDGHVEPARVLFRLAEAERDGWQPGRHDLTQALLRLPREVDPAIAAAAARLSSPAGRRFAAWLRDAPDPDTLIAPPQPGDPAPAPGPETLVGAPAGEPRPEPAGMACWPQILPGHREVVARHVLGHAAVLPDLARSAGAFGPAFARALAYALGSPRAGDRAHAVAALAHLARHGGADPELLARELAAWREAPTDALADLARGGAQHLVWAVARTLVPALLRLDDPPAGLPGLLALTAATATAIGARADLPEVAAAATAAGTGRLRAEAARLASVLS